jgi:23S rRNA U2552 (ribose-2'-O)-methylase RlmE/FtsJ
MFGLMDLRQLPGFGRHALKPNGSVLIKTFQGLAPILQQVRFATPRFATPDASRFRGSELYLLASGFRMV